MAAHTWELDRDLNLARWAGDQTAVQRLGDEIAKARSLCAPHVPNPERSERCYKCGQDLTAKPGLHKAAADTQVPNRRIA